MYVFHHVLIDVCNNEITSWYSPDYISGILLAVKMHLFIICPFRVE